MSLEKIRNTLIYSSNVDQDTKDLPVSNSIINEDPNGIVDIASTEAINSITVLNEIAGINADFETIRIPTNEGVNTDELNKIKSSAVYTTGLTDDEKTEQLSLVQQIYTDVTTGVVPRDLEKYGFAGFNITSGDDKTTGFEDLNFREESGFEVGKKEDNPKVLEITHNGFSSVYIGGKKLDAVEADTLYFKGEKLEFTSETNEFNQKYVVINNKYFTIESMDDVALDSPLQENELLMQQGGKLKKIDLDFITEIAPTTVYGGEF